ncbi:MAG: nitroreductase family protein [Candidatus Omnitrophica bacterium]|nr:nitroreductase family protein [Candidatus Omnitrophota bacterium]
MQNNIIENIKSRRSVREFLDKPIPEDIAEKIIEAGRFAPSALNRQAWKFIPIDNKELISELSGIATKRVKMLYKLSPLLKPFMKDLKDERFLNTIKKTAENPGDTVFYGAPLVVFVAGDTGFSDARTDCHLAAQNMMLAAYSMGIGSCFIGRGRAIPKKIFLKKIGLPPSYNIDACVIFGYPKAFPKTPPARKEDTVLRI